MSDAEQDQSFLYDCFVDTGDLDVLRDVTNPRRIVLGRTGANKSALLMQFMSEEQDRVISIKPESLALNYISNSNTLNFVLDLGVSLDIFFRLLWRHVFVVEVLKAHFKLQDEADSLGLIEKIKHMFRDDRHDRALAYLRQWGKSFWEDTDYRIKEVTTKVESDLKASIGSLVPGAKISVGGAQKVSEEEKQEIIPRAQEVINKVHIRELSDIIDLLGDVLKQNKARYYILIDRLDENWVSDKLRYLLIRALKRMVTFNQYLQTFPLSFQHFVFESSTAQTEIERIGQTPFPNEQDIEGDPSKLSITKKQNMLWRKYYDLLEPFRAQKKRYELVRTVRKNLKRLATIGSNSAEHLGNEIFLSPGTGETLYLDTKGVVRRKGDPFEESIDGVEFSRIRSCLVCARLFWAKRVDQRCCSKRHSATLRKSESRKKKRENKEIYARSAKRKRARRFTNAFQ